MTGAAERRASAPAISQQKTILLTISSTTAALRSNHYPCRQKINHETKQRWDASEDKAFF
jgi:hypothetical protein